MKLLKGKKISEKILLNLKNRISKEKLKPGLAVILVGRNKASEIYVGLKEKASRKVGIRCYIFKFSEKEKESKVIEKILDLNKNKKINGIIVQLPLPKKFDTQNIVNALDLEKDADGFSAYGGSAVGGHLQKKSISLQPVFPHAIARLIKSSGAKTKNKRAIILANSAKFGEVMKVALDNKGMKACYVLAKNLKNNLQKIKTADILVTALGKPGLIKGDMIKKGVVIIDGGISKRDGRVLGDVDFESVKNKASYITPVPGGVGPVTIACLLENVYLAAKKQSK